VAQLSTLGHIRTMIHFDITKVEAAIREQNHWEETVEWRFGTATRFYIARVEDFDTNKQTKRTVYTVTVCCDYELRCECKSLERALHFCEVFQGWIETGWKTEGWPGWTSATQP